MQNDETLNQLQKEMKEAMRDLDFFCKKNNLKYSLFGGTALGAVRHKGFIPWDDDFDIVMPREDFDVLLKLYASSKYHIKKPGDKNYYYPFAKLQINSIPVKEFGRKGKMCLWIDIFPVDKITLCDALINEYKKVDKMITYRGLSYPPYYLLKNNKLKVLRFLKYSFDWVISQLHTMKGLIRKLNAVLKKYSGEEYHRLIWANLKNRGFLINAKYDFNNLVDIKFDDCVFCIFANWDEMLKLQYGDYMTIPKDCNKIVHNFKLL